MSGNMLRIALDQRLQRDAGGGQLAVHDIALCLPPKTIRGCTDIDLIRCDRFEPAGELSAARYFTIGIWANKNPRKRVFVHAASAKTDSKPAYPRTGASA